LVLGLAVASIATLVTACGGGSSSSTGTSTGLAGAGGGDPCKSDVAFPPNARDATDQPGDVLWVDTPEITHDKDYFAYAPYVAPGAPTNWKSPVDFSEGLLWLHVDVISTPPGAEFPIYYTVTWQPGEPVIGGFLRAAVEIDHAGPAAYDAVADVRSVEYSPDGSCCQSVCDRPWPWEAAWDSVAGDVVVLSGNGFPLTVKTRLVLRPPPGSTP
jgi:hypothetical protein